MSDFDYANIDYSDLDPVRELLDDLYKVMRAKTDFKERDHLVRRIEQEKFRLAGTERLLIDAVVIEAKASNGDNSREAKEEG